MITCAPLGGVYCLVSSTGLMGGNSLPTLDGFQTIEGLPIMVMVEGWSRMQPRDDGHLQIPPAAGGYLLVSIPESCLSDFP